MNTDKAPTLDLNCDMGESFGQYVMGNDAGIMPYISSANIACGFHAGDPNIMAKTVKLALEHHVAVGAHPGLPDLQGFGRRNINISPEEAYTLTLYQIGALSAFVTAEGSQLHHVKPHGALYNMAARDPDLAKAIAEAVYQFNPELILYGLAGSCLISQAETIGLRTASEVFADRSYQSNGQLTPRDQTGAMLEDKQKSLEQIRDMVLHNQVTSLDGQIIAIQADTLCIHGDGPWALDFVRGCERFLQAQGITIQTIQAQ
ncbi:LamB/YcsF family protein [Endozoicomonas numazuensis]|uniref:5-oxoprolinase subunit A n=1 Tax=Endozoicomonas numazuensis TaxID=1137799 RepID=A0A081NM31_9GAMM|nr:5-oxoprolinase subunit PxpA [Endozoicomonas numazuensis]KEQ19504.1 LamB/YcsF family protein [Endozoicomonas numazuensis]